VLGGSCVGLVIEMIVLIGMVTLEMSPSRVFGISTIERIRCSGITFGWKI